MSQIEFVAKAKKLYFQSIEKAPISSAYTMGNLFLIAHDKNAKNDIRSNALKQINEIVKQMKPEHFDLIVRSMLKISSARWKIMNQKNKRCIEAFKIYFPILSDVFKYIGYEQLHSLVIDIQTLRTIQICIIRKHLHDNNLKDPFAKFSYNLLLDVDSQRNSLYVTQYIEKCQTLPKNQLAKLGRMSSDYALAVLSDLGNHIDSFSLIRIFVESHPDLKDTLYDTCYNRLRSLPWDDRELKIIRQELTLLKANFPKFGNLIKEKRTVRTSATLPVVKRNDSERKLTMSGQIFRDILAVGFISALSFFSRSAEPVRQTILATRQTGQMKVLASTALRLTANLALNTPVARNAILPVSLALGLGVGVTSLYYAYDRRNKIDDTNPLMIDKKAAKPVKKRM